MVESSKRCTPLQIFVKCSKLKSQDSDLPSSFISFYEKVFDEPWVAREKTEIIKQSKDPVFATPLNINYYFQENQKIRCEVHLSEDSDIFPEDSTASYEFFIGKLLGSQGQTLVQVLKTPAGLSIGYIVLKAEQVVETNDKVLVHIIGKKLEDISGFFTPFEPFFTLSGYLPSGEKSIVYTSQYMNGRNVSWEPFEKTVNELCHGKYDEKISINLFDHKTLGDHEYIASCSFTLNQVLIEGVQRFELINEKKKSRNEGYKNSGFIIFHTCKISTVYSFLDYIRGGCHIPLDIAIDFTGSNKHPSSPNSLHYIDSDQSKLNHYQQALKAVSEILLQYNIDKKVAVYGFGGKIDNVISHCFPLTLDQENPYVSDVQGILNVYSDILNVVGLSGPTRFSEVLKRVITELEHETIQQFQQTYKILLILTDGEIDDMQETINWIVRGSLCPLSIVIVGIGNENFQKMKVLDADDLPLVDTDGRKMLRDIVQFVPFREVNNSPQRLVSEVLDEIPREIVNFFRMKGIKPNPPIEAPLYAFKSNLEDIII